MELKERLEAFKTEWKSKNGAFVKEVGVKDSQKRAVLIVDFVGIHVGVVHLDVGPRAEGDAVELGGEAEDAFLDVFQLEIGTEHLAVDVVLFELKLVA